MFPVFFPFIKNPTEFMSKKMKLLEGNYKDCIGGYTDYEERKGGT